MELFSKVVELAREIVQEGSLEYEALLAQKVAENTEETDEDHQKIDEALNQNVGENSIDQDQRVEENIEQHAQKVDNDT